LEFLPRGLELTFGALVFNAIKSRVFDQNIEAVEERPRRCAPTGIGLGSGIDSSLLLGRETFLIRLSGKVT
jgi:hypothetical protein